MLRSKPVPADIPQRVLDRVSKMSDQEIVSWSDQALYSAGRNLTSYLRNKDDRAFLEEAHTAAQVLLAATTELQNRTR
jgi:hypothetical protein